MANVELRSRSLIDESESNPFDCTMYAKWIFLRIITLIASLTGQVSLSVKLATIDRLGSHDGMDIWDTDQSWLQEVGGKVSSPSSSNAVSLLLRKE